MQQIDAYYFSAYIFDPEHKATLALSLCAGGLFYMWRTAIPFGAGDNDDGNLLCSEALNANNEC